MGKNNKHEDERAAEFFARCRQARNEKRQRPEKTETHKKENQAETGAAVIQGIPLRLLELRNWGEGHCLTSRERIYSELADIITSETGRQFDTLGGGVRTNPTDTRIIADSVKYELYNRSRPAFANRPQNQHIKIEPDFYDFLEYIQAFEKAEERATNGSKLLYFETDRTPEELETIFDGLQDAGFIDGTLVDFLNAFSVPEGKPTKQGHIQWIRIATKPKKPAVTHALEMLNLLGVNLYGDRELSEKMERVFGMRLAAPDKSKYFSKGVPNKITESLREIIQPK